MNKNQMFGLGLCGCFACYMYLETMGKIEPKQYHETHTVNNFESSYIGSAYTATASIATPFILGTSTLGSNARLG